MLRLNHLKSSKYMIIYGSTIYCKPVAPGRSRAVACFDPEVRRRQMCDPLFKNSLGCIRMNREIGNK